MKQLFEVSWEVCNLVGGIHTVLRSKARESVKKYGDRYCLIGPALDNNTGFVETDEPDFAPIRKALEERNISCRYGRWETEGRPKVILVNFRDRYDSNKILYDLWHLFGVDSMGSTWSYIEPVLFGTAAGEVIETINDTLDSDETNVIAQFHEWMSSAGLLHVKKTSPEIGTVFTTHATVLGRAMAAAGIDIYDDIIDIDVESEARNYGVYAKHSLESICAHEADVFTTVSEVTADEALRVLNKRPHYVLYNGVNADSFGTYESVRAQAATVRNRILNMGSSFLGTSLPQNTRLWTMSGRYEFHNKGFDLFLDSLARLDIHLRTLDSPAPVLVWFMVATQHNGLRDDVKNIFEGKGTTKGNNGITTHKLTDEINDPILQACQRLGLTNSPENKVQIIFTPVYVGVNDGIFNMPYESVLSGFDLGVFPSYYEPFGYTPLECISLGVPTVTTDLAGFGRWADDLKVDTGRSIAVIPRVGRSYDEGIEALLSQLHFYYEVDEKQLANLRVHARRIATMATWAGFYQSYRKAYDRALQQVDRRLNSLDTSAFSNELFVSFQGGAQGPGPHYSRIIVAPTLPKKLSDLAILARNMWWAWHPDGLNLFREIDPALWDSIEDNPVLFLEQVNYEQLNAKTKDPLFMKEYEKVIGAFKKYMAEEGRVYKDAKELSPKTPVAYFSMEFCIHECLPIYSGGLGVLSGDHLKSASDLNIPLVAVGFLYKQGYFEQRIDIGGNQIEHYPEVDPSRIPISPLRDANNMDVKIDVEMPGRTVTAKVWQVNVGRIKLYLLDTFLEENMPADQYISAQLYGGGKQMRIEQEIVLGMGGVRLLEDYLQLQPAVYHLNEGHCGFMQFERIERLMKRGLNFQKSREAVKASSVFTTHTPVPAGNETFDVKLMKHYFGALPNRLSITFEQLMEMGLSRSGDDNSPFSMTVLGLKLSSIANGVSKLHGKVCQDMWRDVWKGLAVEEVPITSVTNGIHVTSWIGQDIKRLLDQYLDVNWDQNQDDPHTWLGIDKVPSEQLWYEHQKQKNRFLQIAKEKLYDDYLRRGENPSFINTSLDLINPEALTVGFARRFATYKRANLLFNNRDVLIELLNNPDKPMQIFFAGKAHPADSLGKDLIRRIIQESRTDEFKGKIFYLENYNMWLGRLMTQGVDLWLNNPVRPHEASGTSGMKVVPNGGLNCSILDGWWDEAYREQGGDDVGFAIQSAAKPINRAHQDEMDANAIYRLFNNDILPLFFDRDKQGTPHNWVQKMKNAFKTCAPEFSTMRMVDEYFRRLYLPTAKRNHELSKDDFAGISALTDWKLRIEARFSTVQIESVRIKGIDNNILQANQPLEIEMLVNPGKMKAPELVAELLIGPEENDNFTAEPLTIPLKQVESDNPAYFTYQLSHKLASSGSFRYTLRVAPTHPSLVSRQETGLVRWA
ncbi:MAG: alpha-glucan family phosphorylase [Proteobacteria bacterium]|nr:alpha-glucan family phosphorylase [Pseudomonadota bacterium]